MRTRWSKVNNDLGYATPYWSYEDIGVFFLVLVVLASVLRLFVRFHLLPRSALTNPSFGLQFAVVALLSLALYLVLKLRHHQPVLQPLGWVWPRTAYIVAALIGGISLACVVILYLRLHNQSTQPVPGVELLVLGLVLNPILEESFFRGCLDLGRQLVRLVAVPGRTRINSCRLHYTPATMFPNSEVPHDTSSAP